jgi:hypothetical protein
MTTALEVGEWSAARPGRTLPPGRTRYQLYRRLGGPQGWSGRVRKISPPPGFDPRPFQPGSSVPIPTELPGPLCNQCSNGKAIDIAYCECVCVCVCVCRLRYPACNAHDCLALQRFYTLGHNGTTLGKRY